MFDGGKLVRNRIPELIRNNGKNEVPVFRQVTGHHLQLSFHRKYNEEGSEIWRADTPEKRKEEFADALQVLMDWTSLNNISWEEVKRCRQQKFEERGGFSEGIILDSVEMGP